MTSKCIHHSFGFERLVEDLIQESMARGDFDNLPGAGKPLKKDLLIENPFVDTVTRKINQVRPTMSNVTK
jgi:DnaJ family protein C protein 28